MSDVAAPPCPDDADVACILAGGAPAGTRASVLEHLDTCDRCGELLAHLIALDRAAGASEPGKTMGRYRIERGLGSGAMGVVLLAHDPELDRRVALKLLRGNVDEHGRLLGEARAMARLSHPNVVVVHDVGVHEGRVFVAMEYVEGRTLRDFLLAQRRSTREVVAVLSAAGRGLCAAHAAGVVHRDFKPENVLVGDDGRVRVSDFGLAVTNNGGPAASDRVLTGTPLYMAPEQHRGERATALSDQFAFAATMVEALTGARAHAGGSIERLAAEKEQGPSEAVMARLPPELRAPLERALAPDATSRFSSLDQLLGALRGRSRSHEADEEAPRAHPLGQEAETSTVLELWGELEPCAAWLAELEPQSQTHRIRSEGDRLICVWEADEHTVAADRTRRAAQVALAVRERWPSTAMVLRTLAAGATSAQWTAPAGAIRVDTSTAALLGGSYQVSVSSPAQLLLGPERRERVPFVGRSGELRALMDAFDSAARGSALAVLVVGPPGIGKSRLALELVRRVDTDVWWGRADPFGGRSALALVRSLASDAVRDAPEDEALDLSAEGRAAFVEIAEARASHLEEARLRARAHPLSFGDHLHAALVARVRGACAHEPLVLVLEDLHWADHASVLAIDHVLTACTELPLLVLATAREEVSERFPTLWADQPQRIVALREVGRSIAESIVRGVLAGDARDEEVERIVRRAGGNPFLLQQTARLARDAGIEATEAAGALTDAWMARLPSSSRALLRAASVLGERFHGDGVAAILGWPVERTLEELGELCERQVLESVSEARATHAFCHALLRQAAYESLGPDERVGAHLRAGEWLERGGERRALVLAEHFAQGGDRARAASHFEQAVRQALEAHDFDAVVSLVDRALPHTEGDPARAARLWTAAANAHQWARRFAQALEAEERAISLCDPSSDTWWEAMALLSTTRTRVKGSGGHDELGRRLPHPLPEGDLAVGTAARVANQILRDGGDAELAARLLGEVRARAAGVQDPAVAARCCEIETTTAELSGDLAVAAREAARVVECFTRAGARREAAIYRGNLGWRMLQLGAYASAARELREAMREGRRLRLSAAENLGRLNLVEALVAMGQAEEALPLVVRCVQDCLGDAQLEAYAHNSHASTLLALGRAEEGAAAARRGMEAATPGDGVGIEALVRWSSCRLALGDREGALETASRAMHQALSIPARPALAFGAPLAFARAALALGRTAEALTAIEAGRDDLIERAARISDPEARDSYLHGIKEHAEILLLWASAHEQR